MTRIKSILMMAGLALPLTIAPTYTAMAFDGATQAQTEKTNAAPFQPTENVMADVDAMLARASAQGKLGLIVMGGNWCHDSLALATRMGTPELAPILETNYETMLVDVAGLSDNMDVARRFGRPVIYGTPTVLIIDPATQQLVNAHDMHQWRDAESISMADSTAYFTKMATAATRGVPQEAAMAPHYAKMMADIDAFEEAQAKRIYGGFAVVGPMVMMKNGERPENFRSLWVELSKFRYQITKDLTALKAEVRSFAAEGNNSAVLAYPNYTPFSWE